MTMSARTFVLGPVAQRGAQALALIAVFGLLLSLRPLGLALGSDASVIVAVGFLLLTGMLVSELLALVGLPHLTGYIAAGVLAGPYVSRVIDQETVAHLHLVNTLALSLIALAGGLELKLEELRSELRSISIAMLVQSVVLLVAGAALLYSLRPYVAFASSMSTTTWIAVSLLWGVLAVSRSPSVTLAIISQLKPKGPLTRFSLAFVMSSDVVVVVLMAMVMALVRPWLEPGTEISLDSLAGVGREVLGSISVGTTLGLLLIVYLRLVGGNILLLLLALSFVATDALHYLHFEPMLAFLCAGFVVQNLSRQGGKLLHSIEQTGSLVFAVFFATTGAQLNVPLLGSLWPVALTLCIGRLLATIGAQRVSSLLARDGAAIRTWGWAPLVSQAGLTQGLSALIAAQFPLFGEGFHALVIVSVAFNAIIGPVLFKLALQRTGELERSG